MTEDICCYCISSFVQYWWKENVFNSFTISWIHFIYNIHPVCVSCCFFLFFCSVWYVHEWTRTVFQPSWFVAIDTHISMLNQKNPFFAYCISMSYFSFNKQSRFLKKTSCSFVFFLSCILGDMSVVSRSVCESHPVLFLTRKCYVMRISAI